MALNTALWGHNAVPYHAAGLLLHSGIIFLLGALVFRLTNNIRLAIGCSGAFFAVARQIGSGMVDRQS